MAMENDVARIRAALNTPGLKYRSFGNQPVRGEPEPLSDLSGELRPVEASSSEVTGAQLDAHAAAAPDGPNDATQKIDWAALAAMAAEPEPAPAVSPRQQPQSPSVSPAAARPEATPAPPPMAPQPLPIPTSQLLNLGAAPPPPSAPAARRSPDIAYALLDALAQPSPQVASPAAPAEPMGAPAGGGTLALLRGAAIMAEPKPAETPAAVAAPAPLPAVDVPTPLAEVMQMIAAGIAAAGAKRAATLTQPSSES